MQWSQEQLNIFKAFDTESSNLLVNASPGSGKTTVLCELWARSQSNAILDLAFNKNIVQELTRRLVPKRDSKIATYNSLGHQLCMKQWPKTKVNNNKVYKHIKPLEHVFPQNKSSEYVYSLKVLVGYLKNIHWPVLPIPVQDIQDIAIFYDLDVYPDIERHANRVLLASIQDTSCIDLSDQLLMPIYYGLRFPFYEQVMVDEVQDTNSIQKDMLLALQLTNPNIRVCLVGDSHQAIYAFRGALADSMSSVGGAFNSLDMPLTISRRCARAIVREAQGIWPNDINYADNAIEGIVRQTVKPPDYTKKPAYRDYSECVQTEQFTLDHMVLCRTTAPLITFAYTLLRNNIPCQIRGRDIGGNFVKYIKKSGCEYLSDFRDYMYDDLTQQIERATLLKQDVKVLALVDKRETLEVFCDCTRSIYVSELIAHIELLFENGKGVLLSTVHRAKGLEADKVYILAPDLMPHPLATQLWAKEQEANIQYVGITRAKGELVYI